MKPDFDALHLQIAELCRKAVACSVSQRGQHDQVAFALGSAIAALAGIKAMHNAFDYIEINVGEREAVWLSRRWAGTTDPESNTWG